MQCNAMIRVVLGVIRITSEWKHIATMPFGVLFILIIASKSWIHYLAAFPQMNGQDHWFPPNQSEYSLFAAFIFQQSALALHWLDHKFLSVQFLAWILWAFPQLSLKKLCCNSVLQCCNNCLIFQERVL